MNVTVAAILVAARCFLLRRRVHSQRFIRSALMHKRTSQALIALKVLSQAAFFKLRMETFMESRSLAETTSGARFSLYRPASAALLASYSLRGASIKLHKSSAWTSLEQPQLRST